MKSLPHPFFDASAVLLSALCLAHCLAAAVSGMIDCFDGKGFP
jgi:hypothetical protein